ncbi:hypothetical protein B0O80DRAFT_468957 [Mortierella sp. GBAus27b]|nr:hypothetical protein B0O80DRAFT_468957 [Mortierella sp. GBAus27b]
MVHFSGSDIVLFVTAVFLPPLAVLLKEGCGAEFLISIALSILGYVPGVLYAWWVIYQGREDPTTGHRINRRGPGNLVTRRSYVVVASEAPHGGQPAPGVIHHHQGQPVILKDAHGGDVQVLDRGVQPADVHVVQNGSNGHGHDHAHGTSTTTSSTSGTQIVHTHGQPVDTDPQTSTETTRHTVTENGVTKTIIRTVKRTQRAVPVETTTKVQEGQTTVVEEVA